ncbi:zinc-ribbon domain [Candidatus Electrothrix aarhusensis]|uniref:Zinc-ribbon domain n=1 Tax=Candidatus Electrothrix aarhusensis TaxID=1859131 RepID=A0A3S3U5D4_9BACT|nr:zinc-ribbon domain [Candidatus Electrothrix aarhusensis]
MTNNVKAKRIKKSEFAGVGMWYQLIGLLFCCTIVGAIIGIPLMLIGAKKAIVYKCSNCMNKIEKEAKVCPVCRANIQ